MSLYCLVYLNKPRNKTLAAANRAKKEEFAAAVAGGPARTGICKEKTSGKMSSSTVSSGRLMSSSNLSAGSVGSRNMSFGNASAHAELPRPDHQHRRSQDCINRDSRSCAARQRAGR